MHEEVVSAIIPLVRGFSVSALLLSSSFFSDSVFYTEVSLKTFLHRLEDVLVKTRRVRVSRIFGGASCSSEAST